MKTPAVHPWLRRQHQHRGRAEIIYGKMRVSVTLSSWKATSLRPPRLGETTTERKRVIDLRRSAEEALVLLAPPSLSLPPPFPSQHTFPLDFHGRRQCCS